VSSAKSIASGRLVWFKSSYSNGAGGECVECAVTGEGVLVRDSKAASTTWFAVGGAAWTAFTDACSFSAQELSCN
jgi:Domain of unknown function (DUF397)